MKANILRGIAAGFLATLILTVVMIVKAWFVFVPGLNLAALLSGLLRAPLWVGWSVHFVVGTFVWGSLFAVLAPRIPGATCLTKGLAFSVGVWLLMQLVVLPLAGMGMFGLAYGLGAPVATLALHMVYGLVLGVTYERLHGYWHAKGPADDAHGALRYTHY